jgi:hypothetical protein
MPITYHATGDRPAESRGDQRLGNIEHRTSNIEHRTSNIEHRTSNIEHRTSNIEHRRGRGSFGKMVGTARFELATSCAQGRRASQATLRPEPSAGRYIYPNRKANTFLNVNNAFGNGERARLGRCEPRLAAHSYARNRPTFSAFPRRQCSARGAPNNARGGRAPPKKPTASLRVKGRFVRCVI